MDTPELSKIEKSVTDTIASLEGHEAAAKSWLSQNWQYVVAISVGAMTLGVSIGMKIASHIHA